MAGQNVGVDTDARDRLKEQVEACDAVIGDEGDSADPVARRRVAEAFRAKAAALGKLGRYESRVALWDAVIAWRGEESEGSDALFVDRMQLNKAIDLRRSGRDPEAIDALADVRRRYDRPGDGLRGKLVTVHALALTRDAFMNLRRYDDASALNDEILRRFGEAGEPELTLSVTYALAYRAYVHLKKGRIEDALRDSDDLLGRFEAETDPDALRRITDILLGHIQTLERVGSAHVRSIASNSALVLGGALYETGRHLGKHLRVHPALLAPNLWIGRVLANTPAAAPVIDKRRRIEKALSLSRALIDRLGTAEEPDFQRQVATARIHEAATLGFLGHIREASRVFELLTKSGDEAVAEAFKTLASTAKKDGGLIGEFGSVSHLVQRAATLGNGDPRITRIAYEESIRPGSPGSPGSRAAALLARLLAPGKP